MTIILDTRAPAHLNGIGETTRAPLAAGTLMLVGEDGALVGVERLPAESLGQAIRTDTLFTRCQALKQLTPWAYLIIVGSVLPVAGGKAALGGTVTSWDWTAVQGALATVQELGVTVLYARGDDVLADLVRVLQRRKRGPVRVPPLREALFASPAESILQSIPGIGEEKAAALLEASGDSAALALVSLTDPRYATPGVGPKTIEAARAALGLAPGQNLSIESE